MVVQFYAFYFGQSQGQQMPGSMNSGCCSPMSDCNPFGFGSPMNPMANSFQNSQFSQMMMMMTMMLGLLMSLFSGLQNMMGGRQNGLGSPLGGPGSPSSPGASPSGRSGTASPPGGPTPYSPEMGQVTNDARRQAAVDYARSQLGINEREHQGYINRTFCQGRQEAWCADFVSTALKKAGGSPWGHRAAVRDIYNWGRQNGRLTNTPQPGDAIILKSRGRSTGHIGLVERIDPDGTVHTIEGNTSDAVKRRTYRPGDSKITAFVRTY